MYKITGSFRQSAQPSERQSMISGQCSLFISSSKAAEYYVPGAKPRKQVLHFQQQATSNYPPEGSGPVSLSSNKYLPEVRITLINHTHMQIHTSADMLTDIYADTSAARYVYTHTHPHTYTHTYKTIQPKGSFNTQHSFSFTYFIRCASYLRLYPKKYSQPIFHLISSLTFLPNPLLLSFPVIPPYEENVYFQNPWNLSPSQGCSPQLYEW